MKNVDDAWSNRERDGVPVSRGPDYPLVGVSWDDANAFCQWLTKKETADGKLPKGMKYRLPTDEEWSRAAGLAKEDGATPKERSGTNQVEFPWGTEFPPSKPNVGNYADAAYHEKFPKSPGIEGYTDGYATTSPVGSFPPNRYGLYDMGAMCGSGARISMNRKSPPVCCVALRLITTSAARSCCRFGITASPTFAYPATAFVVSWRFPGQIEPRAMSFL